MDSRLLNAFHDDPFDGSYTTFEADREIWSSEGDSMIFHSDAFGDVLPLNGESANFYGDLQNVQNNDIMNMEKENNNGHRFVNGNCSGQQSLNILNGGRDFHYMPNQRNTTNLIKQETINFHENSDDDGNDEDDTSSQYTAKTFRSRTDSSSIGDYESHSSDYDDEDDNEDEKKETDNNYEVNEEDIAELDKMDLQIQPNDEGYLLNDITNNLLGNEDDILTNLDCTIDSIIQECGTTKTRTLSTNTIGSDADALGISIDANNFDLAEFITKDDILIENSSNKNISHMNSNLNTTITIDSDFESDSDSDTIVDVENLAVDEEMELKQKLLEAASLVKNTDTPQDDLKYIDNVKVDPSWCPTACSNRKYETTIKDKNSTNKNANILTNNNNSNIVSGTSIITTNTQTPARNFPSLVPNKKQCDMLKRFGCGRGGKNLLAQRNAKLAAKKVREQQKLKSQQQQNQLQKVCGNSKDNLNKTLCPRMTQRGKNLALLKSKNESLSEQSSEETLSSPAKSSGSDEPVTPTKISQSTNTITNVEPHSGKNNLSKIVSPILSNIKLCTPLTETSKKLEETLVSQTQSELKTEKIPLTGLEVIKKEETSCVENKVCESLAPSQCEVVRIETTYEVPSVPFVQIEEEMPKPVAVKRKLNLEEYKLKRRGELVTNNANNIQVDTSKSVLTKAVNSGTSSTSAQIVSNISAPALKVLSVPKQSCSEVKSVIKSLKEQQEAKESVDPIIQAKNKVLRMQELKKAQQLKIIDSTISKKVPRVTKLLPLKDIVKDIYPVDDDSSKILKGDPKYEEISISSVCCNTNISIPPKKTFEPSSTNPRSLLKSSAQLNITTHSLLASIQHEVVKKTQEHNLLISSGKAANKVEYQGENKIIMHLRKDRTRKPTSSIGIQTDMSPEFPLLPVPKEKLKNYRRKRTNSNDSTNSLESCSSISSTAKQRIRTRVRSRTRSRSRSKSPVNCSSLENFRQVGDSNGGYSSRSSRRHRSSLSSSSESERKSRSRQRKRCYSFKKSKKSKRSHSKSSSCSTQTDSDHSDRSPSHRRNRTRSRSPYHRGSRSRSPSKSRSLRSNYNNNRNNYVDRNVSQPAVEERRIVYVGRIEEETTKEILRRKFLAYGNIKQVTVHYKENGMKYGFVTFERSQDAFEAIDNCQRDPQISMYDVSFGGRRAFCRASYSDLDNAGINTYESYVFPKKVAPQPKEDDSFEALLLKVKAKLNANKSNPTETTTATSNTNSK